MASASGSRFIPGAVAPVVDREVSALLHKWGDLDILAGDAGLVRPVAALVAIHRKSLLMPNCYGRLLLVGEGDETLCSEMRAVHFTANVIHPSEAGIWADVARTAVWLCLDENRCFDGQAFRLV